MKRKAMDRCPSVQGDYNIEADCLPSSKYIMNVYFDLDTLPNLDVQKSLKSSSQTSDREPANTVCPNCQNRDSTTNQKKSKGNNHHDPYFSRNVLMAIASACLATALIFHYFFTIKVTIALK